MPNVALVSKLAALRVSIVSIDLLYYCTPVPQKKTGNVLKYETMTNLFFGEGMSSSDLSLDYTLYHNLKYSLLSE